MKRENLFTLLLALLLLVAAWANLRLGAENRRVSENFRAAQEHNRALGDSLEASHLSVARLRMTVGELEEFRAQDAATIEAMGLKLRRTESLTKMDSSLQVDTTLLAGDTTFVPILTDSLLKLRWSDGWVSLSVTSTPELHRVELSSRDTLLQVVHRVPHRWWIFSWGTKAVRQEIRSSNPHTRLHYAEYIELE